MSKKRKRRRSLLLSLADNEFYEKLPKLFPHADMRSDFVGNKALIDETAMRNSSLEGALLHTRGARAWDLIVDRCRASTRRK